MGHVCGAVVNSGAVVCTDCCSVHSTVARRS